MKRQVEDVVYYESLEVSSFHFTSLFSVFYNTELILIIHLMDSTLKEEHMQSFTFIGICMLCFTVHYQSNIPLYKNITVRHL